MNRPSTRCGYSPVALSVIFLFLLIFGWMRFHSLAARPFHNDEGVNGWFMVKLIKSHDYRYDPNNYHGPSLYFLQTAACWVCALAKDGVRAFSFGSLDGISPTTLRGTIAAASMLLLLGVLLCCHRLGTWGSIAAFVLVGFSIDFVYYSRYFIHEIYFVLFTLCIYIGGTRFFDTKRVRYLYLTILSAVFLFSTKETSLITLGVLLLAAVSAEVAGDVLERRLGRHTFDSLAQRVKEAGRPLMDAHFFVLVVGIALLLFLYSPIRPDGMPFGGSILDAFRTYFKWSKESVNSGHNKPFIYYIQTLLIRDEWPITLLSLVGIGLAIWKKNRAGLFLSFWAVGMVLAYSLIPYKTPWLILNLLLPMALVSGYGIQALIDTIEERCQRNVNVILKFSTAVLFLALVGSTLPKCFLINYVESDNETHTQAYVHTSRDIFNLLARINHIADATRTNNRLKISVVSPEYWPLPFYLRNFTNALYWGRTEGAGALDAPLIIASRWQRQQLMQKLTRPYSIEEYSLRPNYALELYIDKDFFSDPPSPRDVLPRRLPSLNVSEKLSPGLVERVFRERRFQGPAALQFVEKSKISFEWHEEKDKPIHSPFSIRWSGYLQAPISGSYSFGIESDDGSWLYIDGHRVIDNGGTHPLERKNGEAYLDAGLHEIQIDYFDTGGSSGLRISWTPPGQPEEMLPPNVLLHDPRREVLE